MIQARLKTAKKAPASLAAIVEALTPRSFRQRLAAELVSNYTSLPGYCFDALLGIHRATAVTAYKAFSGAQLAGDLACVFIAFHGLPLPALAGILVIAGLTLLWRDGHMFPPETSPGEVSTDALILGAGLVGWQLFCLLIANSFTAPPLKFLLGLPFAMAMVAGWRFTWRWEKKTEPRPDEAVRAYKDACRIYVLWIVAVFALTIGNTRIVVDPGNIRDFLYVAAPITFFVIAARLQAERIGGGLFDWAITWVRLDLVKVQNQARAGHLFSKRMKTWKDFSPSHLFEALFFLSLAIEVLSVPIGVLLGWIPIDVVQWSLLTVNAAVLITLSRMWIEVKKIHERVAAVLVAKSQ